MRLRWLSFFIAVASTFNLAAEAHAEIDCDNPPPDYVEKDIRSPMRFYFPESNSCFGRAVNFPYLAVGEITEDTPQAFVKFAADHPPDVPIQFVSPGGDLIAALILGQKIREGGYSTSLGEFCESACAYAILGGVRRYIVASTQISEDTDYDNRIIGATGTKLGVHQFYHDNTLDDPKKKALSAIDLSTDQIIIGILLEYTMRMGVNASIVSAASKISPLEKMYYISQHEILDWNIDNALRQYSKLSFNAFGRSGSYVEVINSRGHDTSRLRIFCAHKRKEPIFSFSVDITRSNGRTSSGPDEIAEPFVESMRRLLSNLEFEYQFGLEHKISQFYTDDIQAVKQSDETMRVFASLRPRGVTRGDVETMTRVALVDNGGLARSEWTVQDFLKFQIQGDRRLIGLAMTNCVD